MRTLWCMCLVVTALAATSLHGEDVETLSPEARFVEVNQEFVALDSQIKEIVEEFGTADEARKEELRKLYFEKVEAITLLMKVLGEATLAAYTDQPNTNKAVEERMVGFVFDYARRDRYEDALKLAQLLEEHECPNKAYLSVAADAAYASDNFAAAESYLQAAQDAGVSQPQSDMLVQELPTAKKAWVQEQEIRMAERAADDLPRINMETTKGTLILELYENEAPQTVGNFVSLVEDEFYNGLVFHRVLGNFMAQGGDPTGTGSGGPGYQILCECEAPNHRKHFRGTLSMAHAGKDTGGSQFFLTFRRTSHLDGKHTVFGRVIEGVEVLADLQRVNPGQAGPEPDKIVKATVLRKRDHVYAPTKSK
ncbi:MAG: peptidylprolyl isomerase [Pirellulaceae bacterium]|nr:peptidylprolyl isomerase [Pirellulaceae bacterium]